MYVINIYLSPSFLYFIVHCYKMFQNKFEIKIFENGGNIIFVDYVEKTCSAIPDVTRTRLI